MTGPHEFLLDTGTQISIVDRTLVADLQLSMGGSVVLTGVGVNESASTVHLDALAVGAHAIRTKGTGLLQHFDMLIDNTHDLLCLDAGGVMAVEVKGRRIPLLLPSATTESVPTVRSLIMSARFLNGLRSVRLKLDSGSNTPFLYLPSQYLALGAARATPGTEPGQTESSDSL